MLRSEAVKLRRGMAPQTSACNHARKLQTAAASTQWVRLEANTADPFPITFTPSAHTCVMSVRLLPCTHGVPDLDSDPHCAMLQEFSFLAALSTVLACTLHTVVTNPAYTDCSRRGAHGQHCKVPSWRLECSARFGRRRFEPAAPLPAALLCERCCDPATTWARSLSLIRSTRTLPATHPCGAQHGTELIWPARPVPRASRATGWPKSRAAKLDTSYGQLSRRWWLARCAGRARAAPRFAHSLLRASPPGSQRLLTPPSAPAPTAQPCCRT